MKKFFIFILIFISILNLIKPANSFAATNSNDRLAIANKKDSILDGVKKQKINKLVKKIMTKSKVPGLAIAITNKEETNYLNYGYANINGCIGVESDTYFELGSMSKAFTALGILLLEDEGLLSLEDKVTDYIPWFQVHYNGIYEGKHRNKTVELKLSNLLYHTSGIPFETVGYIPEGSSDNMLEKTVRGLIGSELDYYPGDKYQYATINYDILGLIIQVVSGMPYEEFMEKKIFKPLGLNNTFFSDKYSNRTLATGYKIQYFNVMEYDAPKYSGNAPAGYVVSNTKDMNRWVRIQLGLIFLPEQYERIIKKSHIGNSTVIAENDLYYGAGWMVHIRGKYIQHGGENPSYSSMIVMEPEQNLGICVLSNLDTNVADYLATNILNIIQDKEVEGYNTDNYKLMDILFSSITILASILGLIFTFLLVKAFIEWKQKKRVLIKLKGAKVAGVILMIPILLFMGFCFYYLPNILVRRIPWEAVNVWGPKSIMYGCIAGYIACIVFMIYVLFDFNISKPKGYSYFTLILLSLFNGIASALIIFTINESFNRKLEYSRELLIYFVFALLFFIYTLKLMEGRMIVITNEISYEKKIALFNKILHSTFQAIEKIGGDRIHSCLNNDCNDIARIPSIIVSLSSNALTLIFCLVYLFIKSKYTFIASLAVVVLNLGISIITGKVAARYWEKNRDIQDVYFGQIHDLIAGFKELVLNKARRIGFYQDIRKYARQSTELNKTASLKILNYELYNSLMYNLVFGVVVFAFPIIIYNINVNQLRENLFIIFYLIGPFGVVAGKIPQILEIRIKLNRINKLGEDLDEKYSGSEKALDTRDSQEVESPITIELQDLVFKYVRKDEDDDIENEFTLGPISLTLKSSEITFLTGGNGSGKSTLGKLITGLYIPDSGKILVNGKEVGLNTLNEMYASVYSDFNVFKKLYGINYEKDYDRISEYLKLMNLDKKIKIDENGMISSLELSTGQKKRLAFVISCLENKPMLIYDEWAAEQDPKFRKYFYENLLPMLKNQNKGVIVITHDDRYFDLANHFIKLERGELVENIIR